MTNHFLCIDGGGKFRQQRYVSFCGYIDTVVGFTLFKEECSKQLIKHGLYSLHYTEAMAWEGDDWKRLYDQWGEERDEKRQEVLLGFVDVIRRQPSMKAIVYCADSRLIKEKMATTKRPDLMLFEIALKAATEQIPPGHHTLSVLCDWEDGFDVLCCRLLAKLRSQRIANADKVILLGFGDDRAYAELQAADMLAYLTCKELERRDKRPTEAPNPIYSSLMRDIQVRHKAVANADGLFDAETFQRMVEAQQK